MSQATYSPVSFITSISTTSANGTYSNIIKIKGLDPEDLKDMSLPNQSETFYLRCFADFDVTQPPIGDPTRGGPFALNKLFSFSSNSTLGGNSNEQTAESGWVGYLFGLIM